jgi:DNA-binding transcriptional LysR family regulator
VHVKPRRRDGKGASESLRPSLDLSFLRTFLAVYRAGSVTRASEIVHVTQPAVSQHLRALEAQLGRALFVRHRWGMSATPAGHDLAKLVAPHIEALSSILDKADPRDAGKMGTVHLGGPVDLLTLRVLPALAPVIERGGRVVARPGLVRELTEMLTAGEIDLLIAAETVAAPGIEVSRLFDETTALVTSPARASRLARVSREDAARDLARGPFVAFASDMPVVRAYFREVLGLDVGAHADVVIPDLRGVAIAVAAGLGVSVLPTHVVDEALQCHALIEPFPPASHARQATYLATKKGALDAPAIAFVRDLIVRAAETWGANRSAPMRSGSKS